MKGRVAAKICSTFTSGLFSVLCTVKTEIPKGGVSKPISTAMTVTIPNCIRSIPRLWAMGAAIGTMISRIEVLSRIIPISKMITA